MIKYIKRRDILNTNFRFAIKYLTAAAVVFFIWALIFPSLGGIIENGVLWLLLNVLKALLPLLTFVLLYIKLNKNKEKKESKKYNYNIGILCLLFVGFFALFYKIQDDHLNYYYYFNKDSFLSKLMKPWVNYSYFVETSMTGSIIFSIITNLIHVFVLLSIMKCYDGTRKSLILNLILFALCSIIFASSYGVLNLLNILIYFIIYIICFGLYRVTNLKYCGMCFFLYDVFYDFMLLYEFIYNKRELFTEVSLLALSFSVVIGLIIILKHYSEKRTVKSNNFLNDNSYIIDKK